LDRHIAAAMDLERGMRSRHRIAGLHRPRSLAAVMDLARKMKRWTMRSYHHSGLRHRRSFAVRMGCYYMLGSSHPGILVFGMGYSHMLVVELPHC
jgi:hypothetical protein